MNQYAMRFAVIRFMPYVQTREFANIGIIITHPQSGYFDFKIEHRYSRLSRFFRHFEPSVYKAATNAFEKELQRIRNLVAHSAPDQIRAILDHLTRPREALIMATQPGVTLAPDREQELNRLFDYFVAHSFAKSQPEAELTRQIQAMLKPLQTVYPFKESTIGDPSGFHASIPLVQKAENGEIRKIIKPIYFGQKDPAAHPACHSCKCGTGGEVGRRAGLQHVHNGGMRECRRCAGLPARASPFYSRADGRIPA